MKKVLASLALAAGLSVVALGNAWAADLKEITVGYFQEWPTPNMAAMLDKTYDKEMGVKINWRSFGNGNEMSAAMASGNLQIAFSQGLVPFVVAVSKGLKIKMVSVAVSYAEADNCVVSKASGITQANAKELEGKKVGTSIGNVTHYKLLRMLKHLGVDASKVDIVQMNATDAAVAFARGDITMGCGWGGGLLRMLKTGNLLMTAAEQEALGIRVFDVVSVTDDFLNQHPDLIQKFVDVTENANAAYAADPTAAMPKIARASGMDLADANQIMAMFTFPTKAELASKDWFGGTIQNFTKQVADFFVAQKQMDSALADYSSTITDRFLK